MTHNLVAQSLQIQCRNLNNTPQIQSHLSRHLMSLRFTPPPYPGLSLKCKASINEPLYIEMNSRWFKIPNKGPTLFDSLFGRRITPLLIATTNIWTNINDLYIQSMLDIYSSNAHSPLNHIDIFLVQQFQKPTFALLLLSIGPALLLTRFIQMPAPVLQNRSMIICAINIIANFSIEHLLRMYFLRCTLLKPKPRYKKTKKLHIEPDKRLAPIFNGVDNDILLGAFRNHVIAPIFIGLLLLTSHLLSASATSPGQMGGWSPALVEYDTFSVLRLQVGLLCPERSLQRDLNHLAHSNFHFVSWYLHRLLSESADALLHHPKYCISAYSWVDVRGSSEESYKLYNRYSRMEQAKFDVEPMVNVSDVYRGQNSTRSGNVEFNEHLVVTLLVVVQGDCNVPTINGSEDLKDALQNLKAIHPPSIRGVEIFWTEKKHLEDYPLLNPLRQE